MEKVESQSQMIGKRVSYSNKSNNRFVGVIRDRVKVALASGTNEYTTIDEYVIVREDGHVDNTYPYFIESVIKD
jgi:hypothetical protein